MSGQSVFVSRQVLSIVLSKMNNRTLNFMTNKGISHGRYLSFTHIGIGRSSQFYQPQ